MPKIEPFKFSTRLHFSELTGRKAINLEELLKHLKQVIGSSIYHHTHRFLQIHQSLSPEPPNDFAYWVTEFLGEVELGEKLASIDIVQFFLIRSLRMKIIETIENYIREHPRARQKFVNPGQEFHFLESKSFVLPTPYVAYNLKQFAEILQKITINSIYFHVFEARLRLRKKRNDFSRWIRFCLGDKELADKIDRLDPYNRTMEDLRQILVKLVKERIAR